EHVAVADVRDRNVAQFDRHRFERVLDDGCLIHTVGLRIGVLRISPQISFRMSNRLLPAGLKPSPSITSGAPSTTRFAPCAGHSIACLMVSPPTACTGTF